MSKVNTIESQDNKYKNYDLLEHIKHVPTQYYFKYIGIAVIMIYICNELGINIYFFLVILALFFYMYDLNRYNKKETNEEIIRNKLDMIRPTPKNFYNHPELIDLFYNIHEYIDKNESVYEDVINNVDGFLDKYNNMKEISTDNCSKEYDIAYERFRAALNDLQAMIYSIDANKLENVKHFKAVSRLKEILEKMLEEMRIICKKDILQNGWNYTKGIIYHGQLPSNSFKESVVDGNEDGGYAYYLY